MNRALVTLLCLLIAWKVLVVPRSAEASPFDDLTLEQIKAHPDYKSIDSLQYWKYSLCSARESSDPESPLVHEWIGYIQIEEHRAVFFDTRGYALTCTDWAIVPGWQPVWPQFAIDWLYELGYYEGYPS